MVEPHLAQRGLGQVILSSETSFSPMSYLISSLKLCETAEMQSTLTHGCFHDLLLHRSQIQNPLFFSITFFLFLIIHSSMCTFPCRSAADAPAAATLARLRSGCDSGFPCLVRAAVLSSDHPEPGLRPRLRNRLVFLSAKYRRAALAAEGTCVVVASDLCSLLLRRGRQKRKN